MCCTSIPSNFFKASGLWGVNCCRRGDVGDTDTALLTDVGRRLSILLKPVRTLEDEDAALVSTGDSNRPILFFWACACACACTINVVLNSFPCPKSLFLSEKNCALVGVYPSAFFESTVLIGNILSLSACPLPIYGAEKLPKRIIVLGLMGLIEIVEFARVRGSTRKVGGEECTDRIEGGGGD